MRNLYADRAISVGVGLSVVLVLEAVLVLAAVVLVCAAVVVLAAVLVVARRKFCRSPSFSSLLVGLDSVGDAIATVGKRTYGGKDCVRSMCARPARLNREPVCKEELACK